ncbi:MAG TPA: ABC transporter permease [Anaerolineaceae bacterium]|jgi:peptide/nickel transport system permease protein
MATANPTAQPSDVASLRRQLNDLPQRRVSRTERLLGPEFYRIFKGILTNPLSVLGVSLISIFIVVALAAPLIAPPTNTRNPYLIPRDGFSQIPTPPMTAWTVRPPALPFWYTPLTGLNHWVHLFGTASGSWDIFYGVVWGARTAIKVGVIIESITLLIGILIGSLSAFYGGWFDNVMMRITEVFLAFPWIMAALTLAAILTPKIGTGIWPATIALVAFGWMFYARLIRGDILSVRERDYVTAARVVGAKDGRILFRHIIPNAVYPTLVLASLDIGSVVTSFAALSFLGIGTETGYADWGQLISFAHNWIPSLSLYWYMVVYPGVALILFVLGWNLIGDALRDIMDPRMRGRGA